MRVLAITPLYPPHSLVGAWLATHGFLRHLVARGHEVTAFAYLARTRTLEHEGVRVVSARGGITRAKNMATEADVVISHLGDGGRGLKYAREAGVPCVELVHGQARTAHTTDLVVFNAHWARHVVRHDCPSIVCHPVVDRAAMATTPGDMVTIVNCSHAKGIMTAWRCAENLPRHQFLGVAGGYGEQVYPRARNFESITSTHNMRDDVYARSRIVLMPSERETWGLVGVEAMCSGIPVIAHPTPGLLESLGDAGIFVDRDDTDGWVAEIRRLDDPAEYEMASKKARARFDELEGEMSAGLDRFAEAVEALA